MAGIERIYCKIKDVPEVMDYLRSIREDFYKFFHGDIMFFVYEWHFDDSEDQERMVPITKFPTIVDRWLIRRSDLHPILYRGLESQYINITELKNRPIPESPPAYATKFKIVARKGCFSRTKRYKKRYCTDKGLLSNRFFVEVSDGCRYSYCQQAHFWEDDLNPCVHSVFRERSTFPSLLATSEKALLRKLLKMRLPVNETVKVESRFIGDELLVRTR